MPRQLAQQRMTLSDFECLQSTSPALRAISVVAELLFLFFTIRCNLVNESFHYHKLCVQCSLQLGVSSII